MYSRHDRDDCAAIHQKKDNEIYALQQETVDEATKAGIYQWALSMLGCPYDSKSPEFRMWVIYTAYQLGQLNFKKKK